MKQEENIRYLLERYMKGNATEEERSKFFLALEEAGQEEWRSALSSILKEQQGDPDYDKRKWESVIQTILSEKRESLPSQKHKKEEKGSLKRQKILRITVAALVLALVGLGGWFAAQHHYPAKPVAAADVIHSAKDIHPGGSKAVLTLANGKKIVLDSNSQEGLLSTQGKTKIIQLDKGALAYNGKIQHRRTTESPLKYNTVATPIGGQYKVVLPDGSKVWLNAASSIHFPVTFSGEERHVSITGEAYFEISEKADQPFRVSVRDMEVTVLGTHFDVKAYENQHAMETTLLEGRVKVSNKKSQNVFLAPGQQASIIEGRKGISVEKVDTEDAVAWKNGLFKFSSRSVASILKSIARWYDISVVYPEGIPAGKITGTIPRHTDLDKVLKIMRLSGIRFKVEGRNLIVLNH